MNITGKNEPFSPKDTTQQLLLIPEPNLHVTATARLLQDSERLYQIKLTTMNNSEYFKRKYKKMVKSSKLKFKENQAYIVTNQEVKPICIPIYRYNIILYSFQTTNTGTGTF